MALHLTVKVYGPLEKHIPGYDPQAGCSVQMAYPSTVAALIAHLGIPSKRIGIVSVNGRLANQEDIPPDRALVKVFHPIFWRMRIDLPGPFRPVCQPGGELAQYNLTEQPIL